MTMGEPGEYLDLKAVGFRNNRLLPVACQGQAAV
jgi:hypothetical protein